jgi:hypothetical protein
VCNKSLTATYQCKISKWQVKNYLSTITNEPIGLIILITSWLTSKIIIVPFRLNEYRHHQEEIDLSTDNELTTELDSKGLETERETRENENVEKYAASLFRDSNVMVFPQDLSSDEEEDGSSFYGDLFAMNSQQIHIFEESYQMGLSRLLQRHYCICLESCRYLSFTVPEVI